MTGMWWPIVSRFRQRQEQPVTGHSLCSANHSRRWALCPPWRHVWHQRIHEANGWLFLDVTPETLDATLMLGFLDMCSVGPPHDASGLPRCIMQTAQRGKGFRQFGQPVNYNCSQVRKQSVETKKTGSWQPMKFTLDFTFGLLRLKGSLLLPPEKTEIPLPQ